mgnify:CR=1 FL=1
MTNNNQRLNSRLWVIEPTLYPIASLYEYIVYFLLMNHRKKAFDQEFLANDFFKLFIETFLLVESFYAHDAIHEFYFDMSHLYCGKFESKNINDNTS